MKAQEQKQKIGKIAAIIIGIVSILCGVATFFGIYFTTKDYRLVKKDYDIYLNSLNVPNEELDYIYSTEDEKFFTKIDNGYRIELDNIIDDNPSFKSNDYKIKISYKAMIIESGAQNSQGYPDLLLSNKDETTTKRLGFSNTEAYSVDNIYFTDETDYLTLKFEPNENSDWVLDIDKISLWFYSLKK